MLLMHILFVFLDYFKRGQRKKQDSPLAIYCLKGYSYAYLPSSLGYYVLIPSSIHLLYHSMSYLEWAAKSHYFIVLSVLKLPY